MGDGDGGTSASPLGLYRHVLGPGGVIISNSTALIHPGWLYAFSNYRRYQTCLRLDNIPQSRISDPVHCLSLDLSLPFLDLHCLFTAFH